MPTVVSESATLSRELLTSEEFLDWLEPSKHADLIDGEIFMHSPVNLRHADLVNFLERLLAAYLEAARLGGRLHREVVAVRLSSRNLFLPDLAYFDAEQSKRLAPTHAPFAPVWVMEALSPWSADRDIGPKFAAYEEHGVQEYWILDPQTLAHRFYARAGEILVEFATGEPIIRAKSIPGFWVRREWLDPAANPLVQDCLREILAGPPPG